MIFTLEQLWHPVPGGTATAALGLVEQLVLREEIDLTAMSSWHVRPPNRSWRPPAGLTWKRSFLPRPVLYESWLRRGRPVLGVQGTVVHSTTLFPVPTRGKSIVTIHDLAFLDDPSVFTSRGARLFAHCVERAKEVADIVLVPSRSTWDAALRHGFAGSQLRLLPLAAGPPRDVDPTVRKHPYILWVGTVEPRKNLVGLIDAFRSVANDIPHDLILVGPQGWGADIASHMTGIESRVIRHGFASPEELASLYRGADLFAFPSLAEGFGLPVLEAMSYGTPIVTSMGTATAELVEGGAGVVVDPHDISAIGSAMAEAVSNRVIHGEMAQAALVGAARYSWAKSAAALIDIYQELTC